MTKTFNFNGQLGLGMYINISLFSDWLCSAHPLKKDPELFVDDEASDGLMRSIFYLCLNSPFY